MSGANAVVTIITPCYNGEKYLDVYFPCILGQTYKNIELIFVNDGSRDGSESKFNEYAPKLKAAGIKSVYIFQENQGAAAAVNNALKHVSGEYIMLYDVDDIIMPRAVELKARLLAANSDYGMVRNNGYYVKSNDTENNAYLFTRSKKEKQNEWIFDDLVFGRTYNWAGSFMVRSAALFKCLKEREIFISRDGQNLQLMMPVALYYKTGWVDEPLMRYVDHGKSDSRGLGDREAVLKKVRGFEANRIEIIEMMDLSCEQKNNYIKRIHDFYSKLFLEYARKTGMQTLLNEEYEKLKTAGVLNTRDKLRYFLGSHPTLNTFYSLAVKCTGLARAAFYRVQTALLQ